MLKEILLILLLYSVDMTAGDCDTAPTIRGAFHNGSSIGPFSEGVVLRYLCNQAFDKVGSNYYQCSNGVWAGGNMSCKLGSCVTIDPPTNSYIVGQAGNYVGETTTFRCQDGYEMNGDSSIMCMADRTWSPEVPTCVKVMCPEFNTPDAQIFQEFSGVRNEFGSKNKITCKTGTVLQGPQFITCLASKTWSGSPRCTIPNCGDPPAKYEPCTDVFYTDGNTNIGSQVEVICLENAVPFGASPFLICTGSGTWNHEYHCLCGCKVDYKDSANTGPINVTHNTEIDWLCPNGIQFITKCENGTLKPLPSCNVTHFTTPEEPYFDTVLIAIVVSSIVVCTIAISALTFFCCPYCKNRHAKHCASCKLGFEDKKSSNSNITPDKEVTTLVPLVETKG